MKRKDVKVGEHYAMARSSSSSYVRRVVVLDADEWYDKNAGVGVSWYSRDPALTVTLASGDEVTTYDIRRKTAKDDDRRATHVWVRELQDDGSEHATHQAPTALPLGRLREPWADHEARKAQFDEVSARLDAERAQIASAKLKVATEAKARISGTQSADVKAHLPNWVFRQASIIDGRPEINEGAGMISIVDLEKALAEAYDDGRRDGYESGYNDGQEAE